MTSCERGYPWKLIGFYTLLGSLVLVVIILLSYLESGIAESSLLIGGWDGPGLAWGAKSVLQYGPIYYMNTTSYFDFYTLVLAVLGGSVGNILFAQRVLPIAISILEIFLMTSIGYSLTKNLEIAGLTAILTPFMLGTLWFLGESHRDQMAYVLMLLVILVTSDSEKLTAKKGLLVLGLSIAVIATEVEVFAVLVLTLALGSIILRNKKLLSLTVLCAAISAGLLLILFPNWLNIYYLHPSSNVPPTVAYATSYNDLVFWLVGSWIVLPVAVLGFIELLRLVKSGRGSIIASLVFSLSLVLLVVSLAFYAGQGSTSPIFQTLTAARAISQVPSSILLALGSVATLGIIGRISSFFQKEEYGSGSGMGRREKKVWTLILATSLIWGSTAIGTGTTLFGYPTVSGFVSGNVLQTHVDSNTYEKIGAIQSYLVDKNWEAPIFVFNNPDILGLTDQYRSYIGVAIGDNLAYYGNVSNMLRLEPTNFTSLPPPLGPEANAYSQTYLKDMLGIQRPPAYPEKALIRSVSDLLTHPVILVAPDFYNLPIAPFLSNYSIGNGIYVIPKAADFLGRAFHLSLHAPNGSTTLEAVGTPTGAQVSFVANDSAFSLSGWPPFYKFSEMTLDNIRTYPEYTPTRLDGAQATLVNDPAASLSYWGIYAQSAPYLSTSLSQSSDAVEGNSSIEVAGVTDAYGNLVVKYSPPYTLRVTSNDTLSFWGLVSTVSSPSNANWVLLLRDASGHQASYWNWNSGFGGGMTQADVGRWKRLSTSLANPTSEDPGFNFSDVTSLLVLLNTIGGNQSASFFVNGLAVDHAGMTSNSISYSNLAIGQTVTIYFVAKEG